MLEARGKNVFLTKITYYYLKTNFQKFFLTKLAPMGFCVSQTSNLFRQVLFSKKSDKKKKIIKKPIKLSIDAKDEEDRKVCKK
jgi:hypothetical protein